MTTPTWNVPPGTTVTRSQIHSQYGGNPQAGISRSSTTPNVMVYSDHQKASANGYDFDGWDQAHQIYYYTGEGKSGDQVEARGNLAIIEHDTNGDALRLFIAVGNQPGSSTRIHQYVGQFRLDSERPYVVRSAPGTDGRPRTVFVFRLLPVGPIADGDKRVSTITGASEVAMIAAVSVDAVPLAASTNEAAEVEKALHGSVVQNEAQLTDRFHKYLEHHDRHVMRYRITPSGSDALYTDLADLTENILYEAKGSSDRMSVRLALGQVLDSGRFIRGARLAILMPAAPPADILELLELHDVGCVVESGEFRYTDMTALERCP